MVVGYVQVKERLQMVSYQSPVTDIQSVSHSPKVDSKSAYKSPLSHIGLKTKIMSNYGRTSVDRIATKSMS